ncbi:MAG TPA: rod-binding protein [Candidatus Acidoferrales bacterium]|nr:rod-binding protein [Candidatus Acidoferrales bacterium]
MTDVSHVTGAASAPLTAEQQKALSNLHAATTQFEGVFLQMVMDSMRETVPQDSIFGQDSASEQTWQSMLDDEYSQEMAKSGGVGLAAQMERQMRPAVLADAKNEAHADVSPGRIEP